MSLLKYFPLFTGILWGTTYLSTIYAMDDFTPLDIAAGRAIIAYLTLLLIYLILGKSEFFIPKKQDLGKIFFLSLLGVVLFWLLLNIGIKFTTSINAALLVSSSPLYVMIFSPLIAKEAISRNELIGVFVGILGVFLVISRGEPLMIFQSSTIKGDLISLLAGIAFGIYVLFSRKYAGKLAPGYLTLNLFGVAAIILSFISILNGGVQNVFNAGLQAIFGVMWLGIFCSAATFLLLSLALEHTKATTSAIYIFVSPLVAATLSYFFLVEEMLLSTIVGGMLIICGIFITNYNKTANVKKVTKITINVGANQSNEGK